MRFTIPQFIERETKIIGPFTFRQFLYVGTAGAVCFTLYFSVSFQIFLAASFILGGGALIFAFVKIGGRDLPTILKNFLMFSVSPKVYLWKKGPTPKVFKKEVKKDEEEKTPPPPKIAGESQLKKLSSQVEARAE